MSTCVNHGCVGGGAPYLLGGVVLAGQQGLAQLDAGGEAVVTGVNLCLYALVVVHQQLHRGDIPAHTRTRTHTHTHTHTL